MTEEPSELPVHRVPPPAPAKLGTAGRKLWRALVAGFDFDVWELPIVEAACRQRDDIALLEEHLRDNGIMTTGSTGQERLSPIVTEVRLARRSFSRLLGELKIPEDADPVPIAPKSLTANGRRAQAAANQRWRNHRRAHGDRRPGRGDSLDGTTTGT